MSRQDKESSRRNLLPDVDNPIRLSDRELEKPDVRGDHALIELANLDTQLAEELLLQRSLGMLR